MIRGFWGRAYVKKIMYKGENRISFNIFDEQTQSYAGKFFAFAPRRLSAELIMEMAIGSSSTQTRNILRRITQAAPQETAGSPALTWNNGDKLENLEKNIGRV